MLDPRLLKASTDITRGSVSRVSSFFDVLSKAVPAPVALLDDGIGGKYATAIYDQFTSGEPPSWFTSLSPDVQSFVILDFLPGHLDEPMTLDLLAFASPASTPTPVPAATTRIDDPEPTASPTIMDQERIASRDKAIIAGTTIPVVSLILLAAFVIWLVRRHKSKARSRDPGITRPFDTEQAAQRWSETTFSTALGRQSNQTQPHQGSPAVKVASSASQTAHDFRRTLSDGDLRASMTSQRGRVEQRVSLGGSGRAELEDTGSPVSGRPDRMPQSM